MKMDLHAHQNLELAETFGLLSDPTRLSIILTCFDREIAAGEIASKLEISQSLASHHLRLLRGARMLKSERRGKQIFYELADDCVRDVLTIMTGHLFTHDHRDTELAKQGES
ncbi:MAG TPA: ArsR family transcriptional regulator [Rhodospirillaceae bacterium]|nr:transcriptional regulator [Rhodospirillaceae bacterium]HAT36408.1 ArsR family transcriptional regulator [Rhodospirillaceae bacterium]|tara:strand:- start:272 stop:607 length:336 start_codon:yes stop_codon:yes gene_type:complete